MNRREALARAQAVLKDRGVEEYNLEAEILLRHTLDIDRAQLFFSPEYLVNNTQENTLNHLLERRLAGEPSAYITGHKEFYGRGFKVDKRVLIPRPETELLVELAVENVRKYHYSSLADIGTGSGCIAVTLALELPDVKIYAADISADALEVAVENSTRHQVKNSITFVQGDLLEPLPTPVDMIIANLPYVRTQDIYTKFEPWLALDGGEEGLDKIRALGRQLPGKLKPGGTVLLEVGMGQAESVRNILHNVFPEGIISTAKDLAGIERAVSLRLT